MQGGADMDDVMEDIAVNQSHGSTDFVTSQIVAFQARSGVIGLGYVSLPFARTGVSALGFDTDVAKIDQINSGNSCFRHIDEQEIATLREDGKLSATNDFSQLAHAVGRASLLIRRTPALGMV
jgi:UDP-N-acetyl-D-mannosaminuronate dehydrogenase